MSYGVKLAPSAAAQIRQAGAWWLEHRPAARDAFVDELDRAISLIRRFPNSGQAFVDAEQIGVRRVLLRRVRYYLYYVADSEAQLVHVLALWHSSRGSGPTM